MTTSRIKDIKISAKIFHTYLIAQQVLTELPNHMFSTTGEISPKLMGGVAQGESKQ